MRGHLVGLHSEEQVAADSSVARIALLRFNDAGKIVEHRDALEAAQPANKSKLF